jgi:hypothetical protein
LLTPSGTTGGRGRGAWKTLLPWLILAILPVLVHLPALSGRFRIDPIYIVSGVTPGTWTSNGLVTGYPWADGNAGVTTEALGGLAAQDWLHLKLPWWNHLSGIGLPLAAEGQTPALFLPFILLLAMPHGLLLLRMVLMALAGCFTFALLRRLGLVPIAALMGAALFALNGTFAWLLHGPVMPVAFLPLILLGLEAARTRFSVALVAGVAWSLTAGFPETACLDLLFAGVWACVRLVQARHRAVYAGRAGAGLILGAMIAAPAIWPFLQALPASFIGKHDIAGTASLLPGNLAMMLMPGIFGAPLAGTVGLGLPSSVWTRAGGYCDVVLVVLAAQALRRRGPDGAMRFTLAAWIGVTALRAFGWGPATWVFGLVPLLRLTNVHNYILPTWSMALAILTAWTVQDWIAGAGFGRRKILSLAAALIGLAVLLAWSDMRILLDKLPHFAASLASCFAAPVLVLGIVLTLLGRQATPWRVRILALCVVAGAMRLFVAPQWAGTHGRVPDVGAITYLQQNQGLGRVLSLGPLVPNYGALFGIAEIGHNYLPVPANWVAYVRAHLMPSSDGVNFYAGAPPAQFDAPAYEAAGVTLVTMPPGAPPPGAQPPNAQPPDSATATLAYSGKVMDIWRLPHARPYFTAPGCTLSPASRDEVSAICPSPSILTRLELAWPGWRATRDGTAIPVRETGEIFQAIALPQGASRIVFTYAPPGISYAWAACLAGLLLATILRVRRPGAYSPLKSRRRFSNSSA